MKAKPDGRRRPSKAKRDKSPAPPTASAKTVSEADARLDSDMEEIRWRLKHGDEYIAKLLQNIKAQLLRLEELLAETEGH